MVTKKERYKTVIKHHLMVQENSDGKGHQISYDDVEDAKQHVTEWIGKAEHITYRKDWSFKADDIIRQYKDEIRKEL